MQRKDTTDEVKTFEQAGGAARSKAMPPWDALPWQAIEGQITRYRIGFKYGRNNWKKALSVPREKWHDGEAGGPDKRQEDESPLGFIRQFIAHGFQHFSNAMQLVDKPIGAVSKKGDDLHDNMYAFLWNVGALVEYLIENEDMFREAFSQYPEGHPKRRQDLQKAYEWDEQRALLKHQLEASVKLEKKGVFPSSEDYK